MQLRLVLKGGEIVRVPVKKWVATDVYIDQPTLPRLENPVTWYEIIDDGFVLKSGASLKELNLLCTKTPSSDWPAEGDLCHTIYGSQITVTDLNISPKLAEAGLLFRTAPEAEKAFKWFSTLHRITSKMRELDYGSVRNVVITVRGDVFQISGASYERSTLGCLRTNTKAAKYIIENMREDLIELYL